MVMTRNAFCLVLIVGIQLCGFNAAPVVAEPTADTKGKTCRMEQQCRWENFKKICTWVKVCR
jgi:hypothetical protein